MKRIVVHCSIPLTLGLGFVLALWWLLNSTPIARADPGDLFASPGGADSYCSQALPCPLQTALGQSINGDTIYLAEGTYTGSGGAVVTVTKSITLAGGWDSAAAGPIVRDPDTYVSKLDGQGQRRAVYINGSIDSVLDGLYLFDGKANDNGGGVYAAPGSNVVVNGCHVYSNTAQTRGVGGGLYIRGNVTMMGNKIYSNIVTGTHGNGGGIAIVLVNNAVLTGNQIYGNRSLSSQGLGGGIATYRSNVTLTGNDIYNNTTQESGGGININETKSNHVTLENNRIYSNTAKYGGGLLVGDCTVTMTNNLVYDNVAAGGGGLYFIISDVTLINNVVADNQASGGVAGVYIGGSDVRMLHTTIAHNSGSGVYVTDFGAPNYSTVAMTNTILVSHTMGIFVNVNNMAIMEATLWGDGAWANSTDWSGTGTIDTGTINIWDDPAFFIPDVFNYHILPASKAVDAGVNAGVTTDIDGQARPRDGIYDIGADELDDYTFLHLPLVTRNH